MQKLIYLFLATCLVVTPVHGELYKWVDENGKIHYSDKPNAASKTPDVITIKDPKENSFTQGQQEVGNPIIRPYDKNNRKLILLETVYSWKTNSAGKRRQVGSYHISKGCLARGKMTVPDVYLNHASLFPDEKDLAREVNKVIKSLDYNSSYVNQYSLLEELRRSGGLSLHSEIISLDFKTCAPSYDSYKYKKTYRADQISGRNFTRHNIQMKVRWTLKDNRDQKTLYETETLGIYNGWHTNISGNKAMRKAMANATSQLLSKQEFVDNVLIVEHKVSDLDFSQASSGAPIFNTSNISARQIYFVGDNISWYTQLRNLKTIGHYRFGSSCSTSNTMQWDDLYTHHRSLLPDGADINREIIRQIMTLQYPVKHLESRNDVPRSDDYSLHARIINIDWESCAASMNSGAKYIPVENIKARDLRRNKIRITIEWRLEADGKLMFTTQTSGHAGDLNLDNQGEKTFAKTMISAVSRLFANTEFVEKLRLAGPQTIVSAGFPKVQKASPVVKARDLDIKPFLVAIEENPWHKFVSSTESPGNFAAGSACNFFEAKDWQDILNNYSRMLPTHLEITNQITKIIRSLAYQTSISPIDRVIQSQRRNDAYSLIPTIKSVRYDSCYPFNKKNFFDRWRTYSPSSFDRNRVVIDVQWNLVNAENQVVFTKTIEGVSDKWRIRMQGKDVVLDAISNSALHLFSDQAFVDQLANKKVKQGFFSKFF